MRQVSELQSYEFCWLENFRMFKTSFEELVNILRPYLEKQVTRMGKPISAERQIASFLYCISDETHYRKTENAFGISRGSMSLIIRRVSKAIVEFLRKDYTKLPETVAEVENLTQKSLEHHDSQKVSERQMVHTYQSFSLFKAILTTLTERGLHKNISPAKLKLKIAKKKLFHLA